MKLSDVCYPKAYEIILGYGDCWCYWASPYGFTLPLAAHVPEHEAIRLCQEAAETYGNDLQETPRRDIIKPNIWRTRDGTMWVWYYHGSVWEQRNHD